MSGYNVAPLENLVEQFERMPGIGNKTAQRLAYYVLNLSKTEAEQLAGAVMDAHTKIHYCSKCCNLTDKDLCPVCANPARDHSVICVVETPRDATAIENTHEFKGVYHVLHGSISPLNDIGPDPYLLWYGRRRGTLYQRQAGRLCSVSFVCFGLAGTCMVVW